MVCVVFMTVVTQSHIMNIRWVAACELDTTDRQIAMEVDRSTAKIIVPHGEDQQECTYCPCWANREYNSVEAHHHPNLAQPSTIHLKQQTNKDFLLNRNKKQRERSSYYNSLLIVTGTGTGAASATYTLTFINSD